MKKSVFITGIAGSGKSLVSRELKVLGYEAHDIEDDEYDLFTMMRKDTGERFKDYDNSDIDKVNNSRWVCDIAKLKKLIDKQTNDIAFYCGISSDNIELVPLFDMSILLKVNPEVLNQRLLTREGTDNFANTEAGRKRVLSWKDEFDEKMAKAGVVVVNADSSAKKVAEQIIKIAK